MQKMENREKIKVLMNYLLTNKISNKTYAKVSNDLEITYRTFVNWRDGKSIPYKKDFTRIANYFGYTSEIFDDVDRIIDDHGVFHEENLRFFDEETKENYFTLSQIKEDLMNDFLRYADIQGYDTKRIKGRWKHIESNFYWRLDKFCFTNFHKKFDKATAERQNIEFKEQLEEKKKQLKKCKEKVYSKKLIELAYEIERCNLTEEEALKRGYGADAKEVKQLFHKAKKEFKDEIHTRDSIEMLAFDIEKLEDNIKENEKAIKLGHYIEYNDLQNLDGFLERLFKQ